MPDLEVGFKGLFVNKLPDVGIQNEVYLNSYAEVYQYFNGEFIELKTPPTFYFLDTCKSIVYYIVRKNQSITCPKYIDELILDCINNKIVTIKKECGEYKWIVICDLIGPYVGIGAQEPTLAGGTDQFRHLQNWVLFEGAWTDSDRALGFYTIPEDGKYRISTTLTWQQLAVMDIFAGGNLNTLEYPSLVLQKKSGIFNWIVLHKEYLPVALSPGDIANLLFSGTVPLHTVREFKKDDKIRVGIDKGQTDNTNFSNLLLANTFQRNGTVITVQRVAK